MGNAFNALPPETQDGIVRAAGGGILAFSKPTAENNYSLTNSGEGSDGTDGTDISSLIGGQRVLDPVLQDKINKRVYGLSEALMNRQGYQVKPGERGRYENEYVTSMMKDLGPDPYAPMQAYYDKRIAGLQGMTDKMYGAAALKAIPFILQGPNAARGIAAAAGSIGASAADIEQAQQVAQDHMMQAKMNLASLQRNEKMGLRKEARADYNSLQQNLIAAEKNDILGTTNAANILNNLAKSNVVRTGAGAGGAGKLPQVDRVAAQISDKIAVLESINPNDSQIPLLKKQLEGRLKIIGTARELPTSRVTLEENKLAAMTDKDIDAEVARSRFFNPDWQNALGNSAEQNRIEREMREELVSRRKKASSGGSAPAAGGSGSTVTRSNF